MEIQGFVNALRGSMSTIKSDHEFYFNNAPSIFFKWLNKAGWPVEYVSTNITKLLGYSQTDFLSHSIQYDQIIHPDDLDRVTNEVQQACDESKDEFTHKPYRIKKASGEILWVADSTTIERDQAGTIIAFHGYITNITKTIEMQQELSSREQEFRSLAENSPDAIVRYDRDLKRIYANPTWERINGISISEVIGKTPIEHSTVILPIVETYQAYLKKVIETGEDGEFELTWIDTTGKTIYFDQSAVAEYNQDGTVIGVLTVARDITIQKELQKSLNAREEMFRTLAENSPNIIMRYDKECRRVYANPAYVKETGIPINLAINGKPDAQWGVYLNMLAMTPQEYQERIKNVIQSGEGDNFTVEWYRNNDGGHVIHDLHIVAENDANGEILGALAIGHNITERTLIEKKMEHMALHDALTGLPNRVLAKDRTEQAIAHAKRKGLKIALLFIDLDGFKAVNDSMGHSIGDAILKLVSSRLITAIRENDTISRQGGDEFLLILSDMEEISDIVTISEKLLHEFEQPFRIDNQLLALSASIGIALYPDNGDTFETLLQSADTAMYKAKESGKNNYCFYTQQMNHNLIGQFKLQNDLKSALKKNEFILHYQPQIDLVSNRITGVEALIRWQHPQLGMIPPMSFIPIAESSGLIVQIGQWVIEEACRQAVIWHRKGIKVTVAVNISAVQFKRGNLETVVKNALSTSELNPHSLELELTESIMMHNVESTLQTVQSLKALGLQLSIDDFGTGYSSLAYLKRFAVDKLKIDQSFIRDIIQDQEDAIIVKAIIQMAKSLNLITIAEGVENQEVLNVIENYGCDEVQGYHFAKPMEADDFEHYYTNFTKEIIL
jgi:diguanylate cyclase (GGDEF)-like protein/PAS domain S-box-containing protein